MRNNMKYVEFKAITVDDLRVRDVTNAVTQMMQEMGFKCPKQHHYLKGALESIQNKLKKNERIYNKVSDKSIIFREGNIIYAKNGVDKIEEIMKMDYDFYTMVFDAMLNKK